MTANQLRVTTGGPNHDNLQPLQNMAAIVLQQGRFSKATEYLNQALQNVPEDSIEASNIHMYLALIKYKQGLYDQAIEDNEKAISIKQKVIEKEPSSSILFKLDIAQIQTNLADIYRKQAKFEQAMELNEKALQTRKETRMDSDVATLLIKKALILHEQGIIDLCDNEIVDAEIYLEFAYGPRNFGDSGNYANIATIRHEQGRFDDAVKYIKSAQKFLSQSDTKKSTLLEISSLKCDLHLKLLSQAVSMEDRTLPDFAKLEGLSKKYPYGSTRYLQYKRLYDAWNYTDGSSQRNQKHPKALDSLSEIRKLWDQLKEVFIQDLGHNSHELSPYARNLACEIATRILTLMDQTFGQIFRHYSKVDKDAYFPYLVRAIWRTSRVLNNN